MSNVTTVPSAFSRVRSQVCRPGAALALSGLLVLPISGGVAHAHLAHDNKITLTFEYQWIGPQEGYLKQVIARYEKLHPNIVIKGSNVTDTTKIITALSGGKPPDIVDFGLGQFVPELASKGALVDLGPYIKASHLNLNAYVPAGVGVTSFNGHVYGLPFANFNHGLIYNTELFKQAGISHPPTTLEELTADAYRLTKVDKNGKILQMGFIPDWPGGANGQAVNLVDFAWLFGGNWYNDKSRQVTADLPQNVKALEWETQFYKKYGAKNIDNFVKSAGAYLSNDVFASGKLAMAFDGEWWLDFAPPKFISKIGAVPFPAPRGLSKYTGTSFIDTNPQVIPANAAHKQEAFDFIKFETTDPGICVYFNQRVFNLPQLKDVPASAVSKDPRFKIFADIANTPNAHVFPRTSFAGEMDTDIQNAEAAVLHGQGTAASALHSLQTTLQNSSSGQ
ncbi:MAG: transporter substrate-binding protein [Chloroflexi bacterium]|nr:transporter substrate-binding protein [Chloroflexota bacterium]